MIILWKINERNIFAKKTMEIKYMRAGMNNVDIFILNKSMWISTHRWPYTEKIDI